MDKEIEIPEINSLYGQLPETQLPYKVKQMPSHPGLVLILTLLEIWLQICFAPSSKFYLQKNSASLDFQEQDNIAIS